MLVAKNAAEFFGGKIRNPIQWNASQTAVSLARGVWTGTSDGSVSNDTCSNWTSPSASLYATGGTASQTRQALRSGHSTSNGGGYSFAACDVLYSLYCIQQ